MLNIFLLLTERVGGGDAVVLSKSDAAGEVVGADAKSRVTVLIRDGVGNGRNPGVAVVEALAAGVASGSSSSSAGRAAS